MNRITVRIDGMMCGMCEAHIADTIRRAFPFAKKVSASRKNGQATFLTDSAVDEDLLKKAGFAFSNSNLFDVIVSFFIEIRNYNVFDINDALFAYDQTLLGG